MFGNDKDDKNQQQANPALPVTPFAGPDSTNNDNGSDDGIVRDDSPQDFMGTDQSGDDSSSHGDTTATAPAVDDLLSIKQQALHDLNPLVVHLDQTAEEKFRTTMMMIQASDDPSLVKAAYEAAKQISDKKVRAQALLDVVNEINYFTQQQHK